MHKAISALVLVAILFTASTIAVPTGEENFSVEKNVNSNAVHSEFDCPCFLTTKSDAAAQCKLPENNACTVVDAKVDDGAKGSTCCNPPSEKNSVRTEMQHAVRGCRRVFTYNCVKKRCVLAIIHGRRIIICKAYTAVCSTYSC